MRRRKPPLTPAPPGGAADPDRRAATSFRYRAGRAASQSSSPRAARPRWLMASFSSGASSAIVRPSGTSSGRNAGRSRSRRRRAARPRGRRCSGPRTTRSSRAVDEGDARRRRRARCPPARGRAAAARFSSSVASSPAKRAERTPGAPPSAAASMPESSAIAGAAGRRRGGARLDERVVGEVSPVSGGSTTSSGSGDDLEPAEQAARTRGPCARCASTSTSLMPRRPPRPGRAQLADPARGEHEEVVEVRARERRALGRGLHLDEPAFAGHDDVRVDLGGRVLRVVEVEQGHAADDAARDRRDRAGQRRALDVPAALEPLAREREGDARAGDRRAARAAVGLQHVAVEVDRVLAERGEVDDAADRAADQPLDLDRAAVGPALGRVARLAVAGRRGEHPVLRGDPAAARCRPATRHAVLMRCGADHARLAHRDERRPGRGAHEARLDRRRAQRVRRRGRRSGVMAVMRPPRGAARRARRRPAAAAGSGCRARGTRRRRPCRGSGSRPRRRSAGCPARARSSACSTWRASALPEVTIVTPRPSMRWSIGRDQRVVRAAEDHGVDVGLAQRRDVARARSPRRRSSNGKPPWMIGARSGHGDARRGSTCGSTAASASA